MAVPNVTLTATLQDCTGTAVGSAANPAKLAIALCGFGPQLPRIAGTSMLARPGPQYIEAPAGTISTKVWGNDQITPSGTYYTISLLDSQGNIVQTAAYSLTGSGTFDLSNLVPLSFPNQNTPIILFASFTAAPSSQACVGAVDGSNKVFTFTAGPSPTPLIQLFAAGVYQSATAPDYTLSYSGANVWTITFVTAPSFGPVIVFWFPQAGTGSRTIAAPSTIVVAGFLADNTLFCNFSAPGTITLPSAATAGLSYELSFIDISYNAVTNPITLSGSVNSGGSYAINTNGGAVTLRSDGATWRVKSKV
jgi:hypothetical protein